MKESIVLYTSQYEAIRFLPLADKGQLLDAVFHYAATGEVPAFDNPAVDMAFRFIRQQLDYDTAKYEHVIQVRRAAGRRGGRKANKANANFAQQNEQSKANETDNVYVNDNDNGNVNGNVVSIDVNRSSVEDINNKQQQQQQQQQHKVSSSSDSNASKTENTEKPQRVSMSQADAVAKRRILWPLMCDYNKFINSNKSCLHQARTFLKPRADLLAELVDHYGFDNVRLGLNKITLSPYANGRTKDHSRPCTLDWCLRIDNFTKFIEGDL